KLIDGKHIPHPHDWPLLLFDEETFNIEDLITSFLRNEMLVRGWRLIFQGPSTVDGQASRKATKCGNAHINGMTQVTVPGLAYVATLFYFALGSQETFGAGGDDHMYDFYTFYRGLITFVNEDTPSAERDDLLAWWNQWIISILPNETMHS
ncbi:hypothetical protein JB92DRAFT_2702153, partial [Gautieria morchelliformis]